MQPKTYSIRFTGEIIKRYSRVISNNSIINSALCAICCDNFKYEIEMWKQSHSTNITFSKTTDDLPNVLVIKGNSISDSKREN
jgi:hypothetical protein